ncbi:MAG: DUF4924 family protein [Reichenbachiella sp.]
MEQNITEQIIEMYRKEDLMRAYHFDIEKFGNQVINFFPISPKDKLVQINHYEEFMKKMQDQEIEKSGHLHEVKDIVNTLDELHMDLKTNDEAYLKVYNEASLYIKENIEIAKGTITSEVQIAINGVYGFLLLKIQDIIISDEDQKMIDSFGDLLSILSFKYNERKSSN